jgi:hypothetical protein
MRAHAVDPVHALSQRLKQFSDYVRATGAPVSPPSVEDWLQHWNDDDTTVGNLQSFDHWLTLARRSRIKKC